jgi:hypothetical protein
VKLSRHDADPVRQFLRVAAQRADIGHQGCDAVAFVTADVANPREDGLALGQRCQAHQRRGELPGRGQVQTDPDGLFWSVDGERAVTAAGACSELAEQVGQQRAGLGGARRPPRNRDPAAGGDRRGEERRRVGQVRLDHRVLGPNCAGGDDPLARPRLLHMDSASGQARDGHGDMRHARQRAACVRQAEADVESRSGQQHPRHELARRARVHLHVAAADLTLAVHDERQ